MALHEMVSTTEISPIWWHFDGTQGILYCEIEHNGTTELHQEIARVIPSGIYEDAWVARTKMSPDYILWKDKEISTDNAIVAKVENWFLSGRRGETPDPEWTFSLYLAMKNKLHWTCGFEDEFRVTLEGNYRDGVHFKDNSIRLVIPLQSGHAIATSDQNRWYFLCDNPADQAAFEKEERRRKKLAEKQKLAAERAKRKAERAVIRAKRRELRRAYKGNP